VITILSSTLTRLSCSGLETIIVSRLPSGPLSVVIHVEAFNRHGQRTLSAGRGTDHPTFQRLN
jgi:hypothetical protein